MKTYVLFFLIAMVSFSGFKPVHGQSGRSVNLNENWIVGETKPGNNSADFVPIDLKNPGNGWYSANMPKQVQDVLFAKGLIPDPHIGTNPTKCTWIFEKDWIYQGTKKFV